jgi:hypothetical protein
MGPSLHVRYMESVKRFLNVRDLKVSSGILGNKKVELRE